MQFEKARNLEGYLKKKSSIKFAGYHKRYFMIRDSGKILAYFTRKPKAGDEPKGVLLLNLISSIEAKTETKFILNYPEKQFILRADNYDSQNLWVSALKILSEKAKEVSEPLTRSLSWKDKKLAIDVAKSVKIEIESPAPAPRLSDTSDLNIQIMATKGIWRYLSEYPDNLLKRHLHCGFLNKRSKGSVKYFQKRWFILVSGNPIFSSLDDETLTEEFFPPWMHLNHIYYFKWAGNTDDSDVQGEIPTRLVTIRVKDMTNSHDSGNSFLLDLGNRIFHLNAENEEQMNNWIKAISASKENAQNITTSITGKPKHVKKIIQLFDINGKEAMNKKVSEKFKDNTKVISKNLKEILNTLMNLIEDMVETIDGLVSNTHQRLDIAEIYAQNFHKHICDYIKQLWKNSYTEMTLENLMDLIIWTYKYDNKLSLVGIDDDKILNGVKILSNEYTIKYFDIVCLNIYKSIKKAISDNVDIEDLSGRYIVCYNELVYYINLMFEKIQSCDCNEFSEKVLETIREIVFCYKNAVTEICERNFFIPIKCIVGFCNDTVMIIEKFKAWQDIVKYTIDASIINHNLKTKETTLEIVNLGKTVKDFFALSLLGLINEAFELPFNEMHMDKIFPQIVYELDSLEKYTEKKLIKYVWFGLMEAVVKKYVFCVFVNKKAMETKSVLLLTETLKSDGDMFKKYFYRRFDKELVDNEFQSLYDIVEFLESLPINISGTCEKVKKTHGQDFDFSTAVKTI